MLHHRHPRRPCTDEGFTLIELMVVVGSIAILLAIAVPTFLASRGKAQDRGAQSSLRNTLTAAKSIYADGADYSKADPTTLTAGTTTAPTSASTNGCTGQPAASQSYSSTGWS